MNEISILNKRDNQRVGNAGLFYVSYELSRQGWNVLPTSRNARGVDVVIYSRDAKRTHTIQVKTLSKRNPVPISKLDSLIAEYLIVCTKVFEDKPEVFVMKIDDIKDRIVKKTKNGKVSYWLIPKNYEEFRDNWGIIAKSF
jgi:hypothetical protein